MTKPKFGEKVENISAHLTSHMPIYYRTYPGNIPDSHSVKTMLKDRDDVGFPRVILVTDRGIKVRRPSGRRLFILYTGNV